MNTINKVANVLAVLVVSFCLLAYLLMFWAMPKQNADAPGAYCLTGGFTTPVPAGAGRHYSTGAFITPTPYPISYLPPPDPGQYDLIDPNGYNRDFWVCEIEAKVHGAPGDDFPVLYVLRYGDDVKIGELSNGYGDWFATVGRAEWIRMDTLCRYQAQ